MKKIYIYSLFLFSVLLISGCGEDTQINIDQNNNVEVTNEGADIDFTLPVELPQATVGEPYNYDFQATNPVGGQGPYRFQLATGVGFPPFGITVRPDGTIRGTPTTEEKRYFDICVVDFSGDQKCKSTSLEVIGSEIEENNDDDDNETLTFETELSQNEDLTGSYIGLFELNQDISFFCPSMPTLTHSGDLTADLIEENGDITGSARLDRMSSIQLDGEGGCTVEPGKAFDGTVTGELTGKDVTFTINFGDPDLFMNELDISGTFIEGKISGDLEGIDGTGIINIDKN